MDLLIALVVSSLLAWFLRKPIRKYSFVFYILAILVDIVFLSHMLFSVSREAAIVLYPYTVRCLVGFSLFTIVMFIGVFAENSKLKRGLMPIRGELSIIASILVAGHVINYLGSYLSQIMSGFVGMSVGMVISFAISSVLIVLLVVLTITSFNFVKHNMDPGVWKKIQWTAYIFWILTFAHIILILAPTISSLTQKATISIILYSVILVLYVIMRTRKYLIDRKKRTDAATKAS